MVAAGATLAEIDEPEITVGVVAAVSELGISLDGGGTPAVTVTVTIVGAKRLLS